MSASIDGNGNHLSPIFAKNPSSLYLKSSFLEDVSANIYAL